MNRLQPMEELAHAKINLSLRVLGRRADGFHEIETLMAPITLHDSLQIEPAEQFHFHCNDPSLSSGEDNLVVRAARLFFAETKIQPRVSITLDKNIPHGAGLGGGSSNAAATLRGLNKMFSGKYSPEQLMHLAARLGSDVAFFLQQSAAVCRGRGELVEAIELPQFRVLLLKPEFSVSTAWAYSRWEDAREIPGVNYAPQTFRTIKCLNDLERPVFEKFIFLAQMKTWLRQQAEAAVALLSGSGSTVFAILREETSADPLITRARAELDPALWAYACETR